MDETPRFHHLIFIYGMKMHKQQAGVNNKTQRRFRMHRVSCLYFQGLRVRMCLHITVSLMNPIDEPVQAMCYKLVVIHRRP